MSDFSGCKRRSETAADRTRLHQWLCERRIDAALAAAPVDERAEATARDRYDQESAAYDLPPIAERPVRLAQVRLVRPGLASAARDRLLYLLVLGRPARGVWLAAPFGRYTTSALPGEIERPGAPPALRVVCLWNTRRLPDGWLRRCTFATALSSAEQRTLAAALRLLKRGAPPSPALRPFAGPPLRHPLDPRHDYLEEEREAMESLAMSAGLADNGPDARPSVNDGTWTRNALPLAAEGAVGYGSVRFYDGEEGAFRLRLLARFPSHTWLAQTLDPQGGVTAAWDGWRLAGAGMQSEPLRGGETVLAADCVDAPLQLVAPDGRTQTLTERKR